MAPKMARKVRQLPEDARKARQLVGIFCGDEAFDNPSLAACRNSSAGLPKEPTRAPLLPKDSEERVKIDTERAQHWLSVGAVPSDRVARFLDAAGLYKREAKNNPKKGEPGANAKARLEERAAKEAERKEAEEAAKAEAESAPPQVEPAEGSEETAPDEGAEKAE